METFFAIHIGARFIIAQNFDQNSVKLTAMADENIALCTQNDKFESFFISVDVKLKSI